MGKAARGRGGRQDKAQRRARRLARRAPAAVPAGTAPMVAEWCSDGCCTEDGRPGYVTAASGLAGREVPVFVVDLCQDVDLPASGDRAAGVYPWAALVMMAPGQGRDERPTVFAGETVEAAWMLVCTFLWGLADELGVQPFVVCSLDRDPDAFDELAAAHELVPAGRRLDLPSQ